MQCWRMTRAVRTMRTMRLVELSAQRVLKMGVAKRVGLLLLFLMVWS